jgi:hypothetical protein
MRTRTLIASSLVAALGLLSGGAWGQGGGHPDGDGVGTFRGFDPGRGVVRISETEVPIAPAAAKSLQQQLEGIRGRPGVGGQGVGGPGEGGPGEGVAGRGEGSPGGGGQGAWVAKFVVQGGVIQQIGLIRADP